MPWITYSQRVGGVKDKIYDGSIVSQNERIIYTLFGMYIFRDGLYQYDDEEQRYRRSLRIISCKRHKRLDKFCNDPIQYI